MKRMILKLIGIMIICLSAHAEKPEGFVEAFKGRRYVAPSMQELKQAQALFRVMFENKVDDSVKTRWGELGFELTPWGETGEDGWMIREMKAHQRGRGVYLFRAVEKGNVIQAPHSFYDLKTKDIALSLFYANPFKAGAWNTVSRKKEDFAHAFDTYLSAFTHAFAQTMSKQYLIQLHGFSERKRQTIRGQRASMIISNGTNRPTEAITQLAACLKTKLTPKVAVYPLQVRELGGTTNAQGKQLRALNHPGFIHIEMDAGLRNRLVDDASALHAFARCLP